MLSLNSIIIALLAGLSLTISQSIALIANRVGRLRMIASVMISSSFYILSIAFLTFWIFLVSILFGNNYDLIELFNIICLAQIPYFFSILELTPYFGSPIHYILSVMSLWIIVSDISSINDELRIETLFVVMLGWGAVQVLTRVWPLKKLRKLEKFILGANLRFGKNWTLEHWLTK